MAIHLSLPTLVKRSTANGAVMEPPVVEPEFEARDTEFDTAELPIIEVEAVANRSVTTTASLGSATKVRDVAVENDGGTPIRGDWNGAPLWLL